MAGQVVTECRAVVPNQLSLLNTQKIQYCEKGRTLQRQLLPAVCCSRQSCALTARQSLSADASRLACSHVSNDVLHGVMHAMQSALAGATVLLVVDVTTERDL